MQERPSRLLWVFLLAYFTFGMITNVLGVVIPEVKAQYQLSYFAAGFLAFGFFIAYGIFSIPAGLLMDRFGAKPLVLLGVILMALGCLVIAWARTYPLMLAMMVPVLSFAYVFLLALFGRAKYEEPKWQRHESRSN